MIKHYLKTLIVILFINSFRGDERQDSVVATTNPMIIEKTIEPSTVHHIQEISKNHIVTPIEDDESELEKSNITISNKNPIKKLMNSMINNTFNRNEIENFVFILTIIILVSLQKHHIYIIQFNIFACIVALIYKMYEGLFKKHTNTISIEKSIKKAVNIFNNEIKILFTSTFALYIIIIFQLIMKKLIK